jgi:hypothetical protein
MSNTKEAFSKLPPWGMAVVAVLAVLFVGWLILTIMGVLFGLLLKLVVLAAIAGAVFLFLKFNARK